MDHIFICYSRTDREQALGLKQALERRKRTVWIDLEDIPAASIWREEIEKAITEAVAFIYLVSAKSLGSVYCRKEYEHALQLNKRIFPILVPGTTLEEIPEDLSARQWLNLKDFGEDLANLDRLIAGVDNDSEWVKFITELGVKASRWEHRRDASRLLRGSELRESEAQLAGAAGRDPQPTDLQRQYLLACRRHADRQRTGITIGLALGLVLTALLSVFAWDQRNQAVTAQATAVGEAQVRATAQAQAEEQRNIANDQRDIADQQSTIALARRLGAQSALLLEQDPHLLTLSTLLGVESLLRYPTLEGDMALRAGLAVLPETVLQAEIALHNINGGDLDISSLAFSPDGKWLAAGSMAAVFTLYDTATWTENRHTLGPAGGTVPVVRTLAFSPDGRWLAVGHDGGLLVWDMQTGQEAGRFGGDQVFELAFTPDGNRIAYAADNRVAVVDPASGETLYQVEGAGNVVRFSPDGRLGAAGGLDRIVVWDAGSGTILTTKKVVFSNPNAKLLSLHINTLAFSPDGRWIASGEGSGVMTFPHTAASGEILVWEAASGKDVARIKVPDETVSLQFSPDGQRLVSGIVNGDVTLWEAETGTQLNIISTGSNVTDSLFLEGGRRIAFINAYGIARVVDAASGAEIARMPIESEARLTSIAVDEASGLVAVGDKNGNLRVWQLASQETSRNKVNTTTISSVAFSPDGSSVLAGAYDSTARLIDAASGALLRATLNSGKVLEARYSPDGKLAASGSQDGHIVVWEVATDRQVAAFSVGGRLGDLAFSPDGRLLAASQGGFPRDAWYLYGQRLENRPTDVILLELSSGQEAARLPHDGLVNSVSFSTDSRRIATAGEDGSVHVWDAATREELFQVAHQNRVNWVTFSPDGKTGASAESCYPSFMNQSSCAPFLKVWEADTGKVLWGLQLPAPWVSNLLFSPDGKWLAASNGYTQGCPTSECEFSVQIWQARSGIPAGRIAHENAVIALAFSPSGQMVASGGTDSTLRLWDPASGEEQAHITDIGSPWSVAFSPDGQTIAAGGYESAGAYVRLLPVESGQLIRMACSRLNRNLTADEWTTYLGNEPYRPTCQEIVVRDTLRPDGSSREPLFVNGEASILFQSGATNLVCPAASSQNQLYEYDITAGQTRLISASAEGQPASQGIERYGIRVSPDGRYVLYTSSSWNLVPGGVRTLSAYSQPYLFDRTTRSTELLSSSPEGEPANAQVWGTQASADWRYFVFYSSATNLAGSNEGVKNDPIHYQVYLRDRERKQTILISADPQKKPSGGTSTSPKISADGRFIAFESDASDLIPASTTGERQNVYLFDRQNGEYLLVTRTNDKASLTGDARLEGISPDGKFVFFHSYSPNIDVTPGSSALPEGAGLDGSYQYEIATGLITPGSDSFISSSKVFTDDREATVWSADYDDKASWEDQPDWAGQSQVLYEKKSTRERILVSAGFDGQPGNDLSQDPSISEDGRYVAFTSLASNIIPGDTNAYADIFIWDAVMHQTVRISTGPEGAQADGNSRMPVISSDGRYIAFMSDAKNLIPLDQSEHSEIFLYDRESGKILRISQAATCQD